MLKFKIKQEIASVGHTEAFSYVDLFRLDKLKTHATDYFIFLKRYTVSQLTV